MPIVGAIKNVKVEIYSTQVGEDQADIEVRLTAPSDVASSTWPTAVVVLVDSSKSMGEFEKLDHAINAAIELVELMGEEDLIGVYAFDEKVKTVIPLMPVPDARKRIRRIEKIKVGTYTLLYESLTRAIDIIRKGAGGGLLKKSTPLEGYIKKIIVITDGEPWPTYTEERWYESLGKTAAKYGITISAIGIGDDYNEKILYKLTSSSGGTWYHLNKTPNIADILAREFKRGKTTALRRPRVEINGAQVVEAKKLGPTIARLDPGNSYELDDLASGETMGLALRVKYSKQPIQVAVEAEGERFQAEVTPEKEDKTATITMQFAKHLEEIASGGQIKIEILRAVKETETLPTALRQKAERLEEIAQTATSKSKELIHEAATITYPILQPSPETETREKPPTRPEEIASPTTAQEAECYIINLDNQKQMPIPAHALIGRQEEEREAVTVKVWRRSGEGRVLKEYQVGLSKIYLVERGDVVYYEVEDPPVADKQLRRLAKVLDAIREEIDPWLYMDFQRREEARRDLAERLARHKVRDEVLVYLTERELLGFGPLDPVLRDKKLENVECTGPGKPLTVVHVDVGRVPTNLVFTREELDRVVNRLVFLAGKRLDFANPKVDNGLLPGVGRLTATLGGELSEGSSFVVRIFPEKPWTVVGLLSRGTISPEIGAYLWLAVEWKRPTLVAGDMGSGKTSYANALLGLIPPDKRIGTAEDVPEFKVPHRNWQRYLTAEDRGIDLLGLVKLLLRANVDYIVINEIRGEEAHAWFQAISTGHGGITTIHADSVESVFNRLDKLGIPPSYLYSLSLVAFIRRVKVGGRIERRTAEVIDVVDATTRKYNVLFRYDPANDSYVVGDLWSARTTKQILELSGWDLGKLKKEYEMRVEFLKRLREIQQCEDINSVEVLYDLFVKYYAGYLPEVRCKKKGGERRTEEDGVRKRADWVVRITAPPSARRVVLTVPEGMEVLDAQPLGGRRFAVSLSGGQAELKFVGFGEAEYEVESDGGVVARGRLPLVKQPAGVASGGEGDKLLEEATRVKKEGGRGGSALDESTVVKRVADDTLVLMVDKPSSLCFRSEGVRFKLEPGRAYGRGDFAGHPMNQSVSREHFKVVEEGGVLYIVDVGSKNGTVVGGRRLKAGERAPIDVGTGVVVGGVVGVVEPC